MIGRSLAARLAILMQVVACVVVLVFAASSLMLTTRAIERGQQALLQSTARRLAEDFDSEFREEGDPARAAAALLLEETASGFRVDIIGGGGRVLASSSRAPRDGATQHASAVSGQGATVIVSVSSHLRKAAVGALARALLIAAVPLVLLTLIVSRRLVRGALRPLREMERRAREASGEERVRSIGPAFGLAEIDDLRDSFDRLLARLDDLIQSERRFTSDASHELMTPLTVLSGELEMVGAAKDLPAGLHGSIERAREQVRTMGELVEALLLLRRAGGGRIGASDGCEPVNLCDLTAEIGRAVAAHETSRAHDLSVSGPDEVLVLGHPVLLASALRNLIDNAVKFTTVGQPIRIAIEARGESAFVTVDDGGAGVPPAERERIFDAFYRGTEARGTRAGTGLGLPILRSVARAHGGDVAVDDSDLGGARFTLRLPILRSGLA